MIPDLTGGYHRLHPARAPPVRGSPAGSLCEQEHHDQGGDQQGAPAAGFRGLDVAAELDCKPAQVALAWCAANPNVSTVITGASRSSQVVENMEAIEVLEALTPELVSRLSGDA